MPAKDAEAITKWYDELSRGYDELYGEEQSKKHSTVLQVLGKREFKMIVDVGCGTGKLLKLLSSRTEFGLGIDLSVQMLNKAKERIADAGIQFVRADASRLPLLDHIADGVTSISVTESGPTLDEQFKELWRIATKDAALIVTVFNDEDRTFQKQFNETSIELVATLSDREQLYLLDGSKQRVRASSESSALV